MNYYIELKDCVSFIKNRCYRFLDFALKRTKPEESKEISKIKIENSDDKLLIIIKEDSDDAVENDLSKIQRVNIKEDSKIEEAIRLWNEFAKNQTDSPKTISYKNLFGVKKELKISREYCLQVVEVLKNGIKFVHQNKGNEENYILKINNSCEFCCNNTTCIDIIQNNDRIEIIPLLSEDDIAALHNQGIYSLTKLETALKSNDMFPNDENLKDKKSDISKWLKVDESKVHESKVHESKTISCYEKYFLNWNVENQAIKYAVNFEGDSSTDVVYFFSIQQFAGTADSKVTTIVCPKLQSTTDNKSTTDIEDSVRAANKATVLNHYNKIVDLIYQLISEKGKNDIVFYALAPYARKNFEKVIETVLEYEDRSDKVKKALIVSEYFGMDYYLEDEISFRLHQNPYSDTWFDIKSLIEKYVYTGIPVVNSFSQVYKILTGKNSGLCKGELHDYSWAMKPDFWKKIESQKGLSEDADSKLKIIRLLYGRIAKELGNIECVPSRETFTYNKIFTYNGTFLSRLALREVISEIKEYKQKYADLPLERLLEKEVISTIIPTHEKYLGVNKFGDYAYEYTFKPEKDSNFDYEYIEFFDANEDSFKEFINRAFCFDNSVKVDLEKEKFTIKTKTDYPNLVNCQIYLTASCYDTIEDKINPNSISVLSNTKKVLQNLKEKEKQVKKFITTSSQTTNIEDKEPVSDTFFQITNVEDEKTALDKILESIKSEKYTVLLGPPGTGKTYTIGQVVKQLLSSKPKCKIFVTGTTNLSIDNCLQNILEHCQNLTMKKANKITKIQKVTSYGTETLVYGSTVYQMHKIEEEFDYIIVDEASQMKIPEFLMTFQKSHTETKFLIVGDDNQLPPIIHNKYLGADKKILPLSQSIFSYLIQKDPNCKIQLEKCYRMNAALCAYPQKIYGEKFVPANDELAKQTLVLKDKNTEGNCDAKDKLDWILNPQYPVVLCLVDHDSIKTKGSETEARLCADISGRLFNRLNGTEEEKREHFWKKDLAIVSPHHVQIRRIKEELKKQVPFESLEDKDLFVGTVDKMQGQEADTVIISYGITDSKIAFHEDEFIYNKNRLNVSITRAKKKLILILSKELFDIDFRLIDDEQMQEHIDFLKGYKQYIESNSPEKLTENNIQLFRLPQVCQKKA